MNQSEYQKRAMATANSELAFNSLMADGAMGLCGESGEVCDLIKKHLYQGHAIDVTKLMEELGDTLWYLTLLCYVFGFTLEDIMVMNIGKLEKRYPDGRFSEADSIARVDMK